MKDDNGDGGKLLRAPRDVAVLLDAKAVAALLSCSRRNAYRLSDAGSMPRPVKLGR